MFPNEISGLPKPKPTPTNTCTHIYSRTDRTWSDTKLRLWPQMTTLSLQSDTTHWATDQSKKPHWGRVRSWKTNIVLSFSLQLCSHLVEIHTSPSFQLPVLQAKWTSQLEKQEAETPLLFQKQKGRAGAHLPSFMPSAPPPTPQPSTGRRRWEKSEDRMLSKSACM